MTFLVILCGLSTLSVLATGGVAQLFVQQGLFGVEVNDGVVATALRDAGPCDTVCRCG